jgi:hypothetical protein
LTWQALFLDFNLQLAFSKQIILGKIGEANFDAFESMSSGNRDGDVSGMPSF